MSRRVSQVVAWQRFRALAPVDAGRLIGHCLRYDHSAPVPPGRLDPEAAAQLHASVYRPLGQPVTGDMIFHVVSCDGTPIAWLTFDGQVVTPKATLTDYQLWQQAQAVVALAGPARHALRELAALRDAREHRTHDQPPHPVDPAGRVLAADPADPTLTWWAGIGDDIPAARAHLRSVTGADDEVLLVDSYGYGGYGRHATVLDLTVLCTIEALAREHDLPLETVGDWLHAEGATTAATVSSQQIRAAFTDAYAGIHTSQQAFARVERDTRGWNTALSAARDCRRPVRCGGLRAAAVPRRSPRHSASHVRDRRVPPCPPTPEETP